MWGYSITSKPRSNVCPFDVSIARMWNSPFIAVGAGLTSKRTVRDSSARSNVIGCEAGVALQPRGTSRRTVVSAGPTVSLTTVTRTSRSAEGDAGLEAVRDAAAVPLPEPGRAARLDAAGVIATCG